VSCLRCGSENLFQFDVSQTPAPPSKEDLPLVCRSCNAIMLSGKLVDLPDVLSRPIVDMAKQSAAWGAKAREELEDLAKKDPAARVEGYMANFYKAAYLDGFFRALVFFRHSAKEGRLKRMRSLWERAELEPGTKETEAIVIMPQEAYTEFEQLLYLSVVPGEADASSHPYKRPPRKESRP
jgi:hypothetical protein